MAPERLSAKIGPTHGQETRGRRGAHSGPLYSPGFLLPLPQSRIRHMSLSSSPSTHRAPGHRLPWLLVVVLALACSPESTPTTTEPLGPAISQAGTASASRRADVARRLPPGFAGNAQSVAAAPSLVPPGAPLAPFVEARLYAIANVAMHDALNAITPRFGRYADTGPINRDASAAAAVLTAAHAEIVGSG